ncbi:acetamidase/formamidase family protein [Paracraurococcus lichenis]|uniref:Acetamidase/formamidase family protein n=1 Tax=Paracraurococcus lichenis TaxID=3064888 RepID=A0ABT9E445_9PROT|nr:acetamidase/formamidase family protein [Paracraurococcus sp. LOR1-02]MDO9710909.1 acetamidase/formamidase family protein [Paracraurococcus sp. LOR1-02]
MCQGDDPTCSEFERHRLDFRTGMAKERRAFLKSGFAASGGAAALATTGISLVSPALAQVSAARAPGEPRMHVLPANAETVHWGYFSRTLQPRVEVESGDYVTIETLTHHANDDADRMVKGDPGAESVFLWTREKKGVMRRGAGPGDGGGLGVHICTGPVAVRGAEPGDVLEVRILDVMPRPCANPEYKGLAFGSNAAANWGFHYKDLLTGDKPREVVTIYEVDARGDRNWARAVYNFKWVPVTDPTGKVHPTIDYPGLPVDHTKTQRNHGVLKNIRVPIRPHFGTMGLAPKEADFVNSIPPSYTGGNIDNWRIGKGATMYYPVAVPGALLSVGDPHASQGDSELCGTAIECSLTGTFQLILHKRADLGGTPLESLDFPMIETAEDWVMSGFSYPNYLADLGPDAQNEIFAKSSIDLAMRDAFRKMRGFLMHAKGLTEDEAISLMSIAVDFGITQVVDGNWGVHAIIKKNIFAGAAS